MVADTSKISCSSISFRSRPPTQSSATSPAQRNRWRGYPARRVESWKVLSRQPSYQPTPCRAQTGHARPPALSPSVRPFFLRHDRAACRRQRPTPAFRAKAFARTTSPARPSTWDDEAYPSIARDCIPPVGISGLQGFARCVSATPPPGRSSLRLAPAAPLSARSCRPSPPPCAITRRCPLRARIRQLIQRSARGSH